MKEYDVMIIGGGASGLASAISSARKGAKTAIAERLPRVGKKLLVTGNGRCNFSNASLKRKIIMEPIRHLWDMCFRNSTARR